jgi:hypothetical protein
MVAQLLHLVVIRLQRLHVCTQQHSSSKQQSSSEAVLEYVPTQKARKPPVEHSMICAAHRRDEVVACTTCPVISPHTLPCNNSLHVLAIPALNV